MPPLRNGSPQSSEKRPRGRPRKDGSPPQRRMVPYPQQAQQVRVDEIRTTIVTDELPPYPPLHPEPDALNPFLYTGHDPFVCGAKCDGKSCCTTEQAPQPAPVVTIRSPSPQLTLPPFKTMEVIIHPDFFVYYHPFPWD